MNVLRICLFDSINVKKVNQMFKFVFLYFPKNLIEYLLNIKILNFILKFQNFEIICSFIQNRNFLLIEYLNYLSKSHCFIFFFKNNYIIRKLKL